jgi:4-hydroxyphenylpyruvate dioxygenase-like putative hemolysin
MKLIRLIFKSLKHEHEMRKIQLAKLGAYCQNGHRRRASRSYFQLGHVVLIINGQKECKESEWKHPHLVHH